VDNKGYSSERVDLEIFRGSGLSFKDIEDFALEFDITDV
jgi:hypothetical protein